MDHKALMALAQDEIISGMFRLRPCFYRDFKQYYIRGDARVLYSEDKSGNYQILGPQGATIPVQPLSTKASWIMENVEAGYRLTPKVTPFVRGGLVQLSVIETPEL